MPQRLLEIAQQDLGGRIAESGISSKEAEFAAARACLAQCVYAGIELATGDNLLDGLLELLVNHSIFNETSPDTLFFHSTENGRGWSLPRLAGEIRSKGLIAVVQNLNYDQEHTDLDKARQTERIRGSQERQILADRARFGGQDRTGWLQSLNETLNQKGIAIPILSIPRMDGNGSSGHSVLVLGMREGLIEYFDSDANALERYAGKSLSNPDIVRVAEEPRLIYTQPESNFLSRMTGEVIHIVGANNSSS